MCEDAKVGLKSFANKCLPYHREEKRGQGQPTLSENQTMSLSVLWNFHEDVLEKNKLWCFCKKIWCTPKNLMKKKVEDVKKTTCSIGFLGFLGSTSTKLPVYGMLPAPRRVEGEMSEMWIIDMIFNFCFARKCLFSRRRNTSTIHEKWMMRSSDVSYFNSTAHEIKRPWPPVSRIRSLLEKAAKCFSAIY